MLRDVIEVDEIGWVEKGKGAELIADGRRLEIKPKFRESAYTPVKMVVGDYVDANEMESMRKQVDIAAQQLNNKKAKDDRLPNKFWHTARIFVLIL